MELNHVKCHCEWGGVGGAESGGRVFVWCCCVVNRSGVRIVGRPTGSLQAAGGAPLRASPRPWCRPGRSLRRRPTWSHSYNTAEETRLSLLT